MCSFTIIWDMKGVWVWILITKRVFCVKIDNCMKYIYSVSYIYTEKYFVQKNTFFAVTFFKNFIFILILKFNEVEILHV